MKKIEVLFVIPFLLGFSSYAQNLTCLDFKEGTFYIPADSIVHIKFTLLRKGNTQVEYTDGIEGGNPKYIKLEWIDDCTYRSKYDTSKMELDEQESFINENNGLVIKNVNINGRCMEYLATLTLPNGEQISQGGKICKE